MTTGLLSDTPEALVDRISQTDKDDALRKLAGLLLFPEYQANHIRFETLVHLALVHASGSAKLERGELIRWLQLLEAHSSFHSEDPPENVFVSSVATGSGNFRLFNGWKRSPDFHLQRLIDATIGNDIGVPETVTRTVEGILHLSDLIAKRTGFESGVHRESEPQRREWSFSAERAADLGRAVIFSSDDLAASGIDAGLLDDFVLESTDGLLETPFGSTDLERRPLIRSNDCLLCPVPAAIGSATRLYLLEQISAGAISPAAMWDFHDSLFQRWSDRDLPVAGAYAIDSPPFPQIDANVFSMERLFQFDQDKILHLVFLPSSAEPPIKNGIESDCLAPRLSARLGRHLANVAAHVQKASVVRAGMSLVAYSSPGWTVTLGLPESGGNWFFSATPASSLACLLGTKEFSLLRFWKMLRHERDVRQTGTFLSMWPDIAVHYSNWRAMHFSFFPPDKKAGEKLGIFPDTSNVIELMRESRQRASAHAVETINRSWARCERLDKDAVTSQELTKPVYADASAVDAGTLRGVVETTHGTWWLTVGHPPPDPDERHFIYLLWQTGLDWLVRAAHTSAGRLAATNEPIELELEFTTNAACHDAIQVTGTSHPRKVRVLVEFARFTKESQTATNTGVESMFALCCSR